MQPLSTETSRESMPEEPEIPTGQELVFVKIKSNTGFYDDFVVDFTEDGKSLSLVAQHNGKAI